MDIRTQNKTMLLEPLRNIIRQGEALADNVVIEMPKQREGIDLTTLGWEIRAASEKDTLTIVPAEKNETGENLIVSFKVTADLTAVAGALELSLVGINADGSIIVKFIGDKPIFVKEALNGNYSPAPDALESALALAKVAVESAGVAVEEAKEAASDAKVAVITANGVKDEILSLKESGAFNGAVGPQGPQGIQGVKGDKGDKGDRGDSGVTAPIETGIYALYVDGDGHLILETADNETPPPLSISDGHLIYTIGG